jgi:hypothetical protein
LKTFPDLKSPFLEIWTMDFATEFTGHISKAHEICGAIPIKKIINNNIKVTIKSNKNKQTRIKKYRKKDYNNNNLKSFYARNLIMG